MLKDQLQFLFNLKAGNMLIDLAPAFNHHTIVSSKLCNCDFDGSFYCIIQCSVFMIRVFGFLSLIAD